MRTCGVTLCESFKQKEKEAFLHDKHCVIHKCSINLFFFFLFYFLPFRNILVSRYKARKLMKANEAYFKNYLRDIHN